DAGPAEDFSLSFGLIIPVPVGGRSIQNGKKMKKSCRKGSESSAGGAKEVFLCALRRFCAILVNGINKRGNLYVYCRRFYAGSPGAAHQSLCKRLAGG